MGPTTFVTPRALRQLDTGQRHHVNAGTNEKHQTTFIVSKGCVECQ
jgi:hypothetical protein